MIYVECEFGGIGILFHLERQTGRHYALGLEAQVQCHQALEAANQQSASHQKDECYCHLRGHEDVARDEFSASGGVRPSAFLERLGGIPPRSLNRRRQSEGDAGQDGDPGQEEQHPAIHRDVRLRRKIERRQQTLDPLQQSEAERDPGSASADR